MENTAGKARRCHSSRPVAEEFIPLHPGGRAEAVFTWQNFPARLPCSCEEALRLTKFLTGVLKTDAGLSNGKGESGS